MAVIGFQWQTDGAHSSESREKLLSFVQSKCGDDNPQHWDLASVLDKQNYQNIAVLAYWTSWTALQAWMDMSGFSNFWQHLQPGGTVGWFKEIFSPTMDRLETVFSDKNGLEGIANLGESMSGQLQEHVYWGSMRDRLAASQTDELVGEQALWKKDDKSHDTKHSKICIPGKKNLALIRSGQDWSGTNAKERKLYLDTMHPVLIKGMDFLAQDGKEVGCFSNRFMEVVNVANPHEPTNKTFGLGYFDDLASLEAWSKSHKTHLDIFGRFLQYAAELDNNVELRLFHEVMVLRPEQQLFEYIGCHANTGMLTSAYPAMG